jgi:hypothetical protein
MHQLFEYVGLLTTGLAMVVALGVMQIATLKTTTKRRSRHPSKGGGPSC